MAKIRLINGSVINVSETKEVITQRILNSESIYIEAHEELAIENTDGAVIVFYRNILTIHDR